MKSPGSSFYHTILALRQQLKNNANITLSAEDFATIAIHKADASLPKQDFWTRDPAPLVEVAEILSRRVA